MPATQTREETLKETAEREAAEAEAEAPPETPEAEAEEDVQLQAGDVTAEPGEQGIATQEEDEIEEAKGKLFIREASPSEKETAGEIRSNLESFAHELGTERVVEKLVQCVDVDDLLTIPSQWPYDEKERYAESETLQRIGAILLRGCKELELSPKDVVFYFRNSKSWMKQGVTVLAEAKVVPVWARKVTDGVKVMVMANYREFRQMNTLQKVKSLYHALRSLDKDAKRIPAHFEGWVDELEHFGPKTFEQEVRMVNAIARGQEKGLPYQLSLLEEAEDGQAEAA